jgi:hypothetical protein
VSRSLPKSVGLGVDALGIACESEAQDPAVGWYVREQIARRADEISGEHVKTALEQVLASKDLRPGTHCNLVLSSSCLREWLLEIPSGISSLGELREVAQARFVQLYGTSSERWTITGDWRARATVVCTAAPRELLNALEGELRGRDLTVSITSVTSAALRRMRNLPSPAWVCVYARTYAIVMLVRRQSIQLLSIVRFTQNTAQERLQTVAAEVRRACMREGHPLPSTLYISSDETIPLEHDSFSIAPLQLAGARAHSHSATDAIFAARLGLFP